MIHLAWPVVLAATLAGAGVYGLIVRRNAVLVLVGAELLVNAAGVLLVTASATNLPSTGLAGLLAERAATTSGTTAPVSAANAAAALAATPVVDPLVPGQVMTIMLVTIAAAEIGLALAVVLLVFRRRATSDLHAMRELGEGSETYDEHPESGELRGAAS